jgi:hypothetical protein
MKRFAMIATTLALGALAPTAASAQTGHVMATPGELKWSDVPSLPPGAKVAVIQGPLNEAVPFTIRLRLPASYEVPAHHHTAIEHVTVISGTFNLGMGDKLDRNATRALGAGSVAIMPTAMRHFVWTKEETVIQVHGVGPWTVTYVNAADDPRKKP